MIRVPVCTQTLASYHGEDGEETDGTMSADEMTLVKRKREELNSVRWLGCPGSHSFETNHSLVRSRITIHAQRQCRP